MTSRMRRVAVVRALAVALGVGEALLAAADERLELEALRREQQEVEARIERLKRLVPPSFEAAREEEQLRRLAGVAGNLADFEVRPVEGSERAPLADGRPSPIVVHRLDLAGHGRFRDLHFFLSVLDRSPRLNYLETMRVAARAGDTVSFQARLALPVHGGEEESPPPPAIHDETLQALVARRKALLDEMAARQASLAGGGPADQRKGLEDQMVAARRRVLLEAMIGARWRTIEGRLLEGAFHGLEGRQRSRLAAGLAGFAARAADRPVALREVRFAGEGVLEGVAVGAAALAGIEPALAESGFEVLGVKDSRAGACRAFTATVRVKGGDPPEEASVHGNGVFDDRTAALCEAAPEPAVGPVVARGAATDGDDALTLRLRDTDLVDVFHALNGLTSQSFVLDPDVRGRVRVDLEGATAEDALAAMRSAGVEVGPGPLRRVSLGEGGREPAGRPPSRHTGQAVSFSFRRGDLRDVLCLFEEFSGLEVWVPRGLSGRTSVFASARPWDELLAGIASSAGLVSEVEEGKVVLASGPGRPGSPDPVKVCGMSGDGPPRRSWFGANHPMMVGPDDLELAGVARVRGSWRGYAYGPARVFWSLEAGQELFGGRVAAVSEDGVSLRTEAGRQIDLRFPR